MSLKDLYGGNYLKATDISGEVTDEIVDVTVEQIRDNDGTRPKGCLHFKDLKKGLILNATNYRACAGAWGDEDSTWIGQQIVVYSTRTMFAGKEVDALRLRIPG